MVQFYPWFKFYFLLNLGVVMYDNELKTKENKIETKDKIEPQQICMSVLHNRFLFFPYLIVHQVFHSLRSKRFKKAGDESKKEDPSRINLIGSACYAG